MYSFLDNLQVFRHSLLGRTKVLQNAGPVHHSSKFAHNICALVWVATSADGFSTTRRGNVVQLVKCTDLEITLLSSIDVFSQVVFSHIFAAMCSFGQSSSVQSFRTTRRGKACKANA